MCRQAEQHGNALITAQNHGTILGMVAWFLACLLAFCTGTRIVSRCRSQRLHSLALLDDIVVVAAALCGIGATVVIATAVDSGLGKLQCLISPVDIEDVQMKVFISTILVVFTLSISKCSILLFLHQLANSTLQRLGIMVVGAVMMIWTLGVMAGIVFECEMPRPWALWTGKCIPFLLFWIVATIIDIVIDLTLIILSAQMVSTVRFEYHWKALVMVLFSIRSILIVLSCVRLHLLQKALSDEGDPTFDYVPYATTTQAHSTLSVILACNLALKPFTSLLQARCSPLLPNTRHEAKHWSGSTIAGTPYESYKSFESNPNIAKEPLHRIQRSMSTPTSPVASRYSPDQDILLPEVLLPTRFTKAPPRPPPPTDAERPDLSIFTKTTVVREPPMVIRLGSVRDKASASAWERFGKKRSLGGRGLS